jgi:hypothetical protein
MKQLYFLRKLVCSANDVPMYKERRIPRFLNIRIDSLLKDDPMLMAVSICSPCGALLMFFQSSEHFPYIAFVNIGLLKFKLIKRIFPICS